MLDPSSKTVLSVPGSRWPAVPVLVVAGPVLYGAGLWAGSTIHQCSLGRAICLDATAADQCTPAALTARALTALGALLMVFVVPWLLAFSVFRRIESKRATAGAWSLALNSLALILLCLILRNTAGISRGSFLVALLVWTAALFCAARPATAKGRPKNTSGTVPIFPQGKWDCPPLDKIRFKDRHSDFGILIGAATAVVGIALFGRQQFLQCFNGDGTEAFELARSLRGHLLPYWEIEAVERFGTAVGTPALVNSYWTFALQLLLGEGEAATRLSYWIWWLGLFAVALQITAVRNAAVNWLVAVPLALAGLLSCVWYTFYTGYYPYMADLAAPGVSDALFTLLVLLAWDCLRREDLAGWVVLTAMASLVLYAGPVMFVLTAAAAIIWQPVPRNRMLRAAFGGAALLLSIACLYVAWGWFEGSLDGWWATLQEEYFADFYASTGSSASRPCFIGYFLLGCGGICAIGLLRPFIVSVTHISQIDATSKTAPADDAKSEVAWAPRPLSRQTLTRKPATPPSLSIHSTTVG